MVGEVGVGLEASGGEHAHALRLGPLARERHQRALADPGLAAQQQRVAATVLGRREQRLDAPALSLTADQHAAQPTGALARLERRGGVVVGVMLMRALVPAVIVLGCSAGVAAAQRPLGVVDQTLARFDRDTLTPLGPALDIVEPHAAPVFSPTGDRLAVGLSEPSQSGNGGRVGLWVVDPTRMEVLHRVQTGIAVEAVAFPGVVAALTQGGAMVVVDPASGRIVRRRQVGFTHCGPRAVAVGRTAVFVNEVLPRAVEVTTVGAGGQIASRRIPLLVDARAPGCRSAPLVADPRRGRVLVAGATDVASIDARTLRARRHRIGDRAASRTMAVLPGDGLAIAGERGLRVLDARTWSPRWRDRRARAITADGSIVLALGDRLRARDAASGRLRWRARATSASVMTAAAGRVYLQGRGPIRILASADGRQVGSHPPLTTTLRFAAAP